MYTSVPQAPAGVCTCTWVYCVEFKSRLSRDIGVTTDGQRRGRFVL